MLSVQSVASSPSLKLNDSIEARPLANYQRAKHSGRIGIKVVKDGTPFLVMPTHVITEAIMAKSMRNYVSGRSQSDRAQKLRRDWNKYADIWAGNGKVRKLYMPISGMCVFKRRCGKALMLTNVPDWDDT